LNRG
jgi:hypothetical protein